MDDAAVVVHRSNRIAVHLAPCDVLVRVGLARAREHMALEVEVARQLAAAGAPVGEPDPRAAPRVREHDGFVLTLWRWYEPVGRAEITPAEYAGALLGLHAGLRQVDVPTPHFTDRVDEARQVVDGPEESPEPADADRALLTEGSASWSASAARAAPPRRAAPRQPAAHLDPDARHRLRDVLPGPVEFDLPPGLLPSSDGALLPSSAEVGARYPGADLARGGAVPGAHLGDDHDLAVQRGDMLPNRAHWADEGLGRLRMALDA